MRLSPDGITIKSAALRAMSMRTVYGIDGNLFLKSREPDNANVQMRRKMFDKTVVNVHVRRREIVVK